MVPAVPLAGVHDSLKVKVAPDLLQNPTAIEEIATSDVLLSVAELAMVPAVVVQLAIESPILSVPVLSSGDVVSAPDHSDRTACIPEAPPVLLNVGLLSLALLFAL
jgi:hypothetical protein